MFPFLIEFNSLNFFLAKVCGFGQFFVNGQNGSNGGLQFEFGKRQAMRRGFQVKLSFDKNRFILSDIPRPLGLSREFWKFDSQLNAIFTSNLKEAARFRTVEDEKAKRIFDKFALRSIPLPSGGLTDSFFEPLMPFQRERGIPFILSRNRSYLAHDPGLGKSAQFITSVALKPGKTLVICPSFLRINWAREITKWFIRDFPSIAVVPETAKRTQMNWNADFIICSDSMVLRSWVRHALTKIKFRHIGIDEGHRFKNPGASRSIVVLGGRKGAIKSPGLIYNSEHTTILSGTPMLSRPIELWSILFSMAPEVIDFMSYLDFGYHFCGPRRDARGNLLFTGCTNAVELKSRIYNSGFMQRIAKDDVLPDLPDKVREIVWIGEDPRPKDVKAFDLELTKHFETEFEKPKSLGSWARFRKITGLAKVDFAVNFITEILREDPDEALIVFAYHREVVEKLAAGLSLFAPMVVMGGVPNEKRIQIEDAFQSGRRRLLIGNIKAMNLGLTLTRARRGIFVEYSETPTENVQAEDRMHRIGQADSVFCQYLVLTHSIDEVYLNMILSKQKTIKKVIG